MYTKPTEALNISMFQMDQLHLSRIGESLDFAESRASTPANDTEASTVHSRPINGDDKSCLEEGADGRNSDRLHPLQPCGSCQPRVPRSSFDIDYLIPNVFSVQS